jgi:hypothetical protein
LVWVGAIVAAYVVAWRAPAVGFFHDDGLYAVTAKALAEGQGYRIASLPTPIPQTKYPVLFPALLSVVWRAFPTFPANVPWLRLVPLAAVILWLTLSVTWLRQRGATATQARLIAAAAASTSWAIFLSSSLLSESLFAALVVAALILAHRVEQSGPASWKLAAATGCCAGLAMHTRSAALALGLAIGISWVWRRRWADIAVFAVVLVALTAPWFWWVRHAEPAGLSPVEAYYTATNYRLFNLFGDFTWFQRWSIVLLNSVQLVASPAALIGLGTSGWAAPLVVVLFALALRGAFREPLDSTSAFAALYTMQVLAWVWPPLRFMAPLLPLVLWFVWRGVPDRAVRLRTGVAIALAVIVARGTIMSTEQVIRTGYPVPGPQRPDDWQTYQRMLDWVRTQTPSDAVVGANLDPNVSLFAGRRAIRPFRYAPYELMYAGPRTPLFPLGTPAEFVEWLRRFRIDYLILTPSRSLETVQMAKLIAFVETIEPQAFIRHVIDPAGYVIYQVDRTRLAAHPGVRSPGSGVYDK